MEVFKSLWKPRGNISIPQYDAQDGVDLQVKSLLYMYKRLGIAKSGDKLGPVTLDSLSEEDLGHLDRMYNLEKFESIVNNDPHRVLVDWPKNRFRAMLILAHYPQMEKLPEFGDKFFAFSVLEADASNDEYIKTLSRSNIYAEHSLPIEIRREIAASVVRRFKQRDLQARWQIIVEYLRLVAVEIQVARIYKAMLAKVSSNQSSPSHSPSLSPLHSRSSSPNRSPSPTGRVGTHVARPPSPSRFPRVAQTHTSTATAHNSTKLAQAPKLTASHQSSPHHSPSPSPPGSPSSPSSRPRIKSSQPNLKLASAPTLSAAGGVGPSLDAGKAHILQQARLAVRARIEKEQRSMH